MAKAAKAKTRASTTKKAKVTKKPTTVKRVASKKAKAAPAAQQPFFQIKITDQTIYWLIFGVAAVLFAMWLYTLDSKVRDLYDQIDMDTYNSSVIPEPTKDKKTEE